MKRTGSYARKILALFISLVMVVGLMPAVALADASVTTEGFRYTVSDDEATITGYEGTATELVIPSEVDGYAVVAIGDRAFSGFSALESVTISEGIVSIGQYAFRDCSSLNSVSIPSSLDKVKDAAFSGCTQLDSVHISDLGSWIEMEFESTYTSNPLNYANGLYLNGDIVTSLVTPEGVSFIGRGVFYNYDALESVVISEGVTSIEFSAFSGCSALESIELPSTLKSINAYAFERCESLNDVVIPEGVESIGNYAFSGCSALESVKLPSTIVSMGSYVFSECDALRDLEICEGVTAIGLCAFQNCPTLQSVKLPSTLKSIGSGAFSGCNSIENVDMSDIAAWCAIEFENLGSNPLCHGGNLFLNGVLVSDLVIPNGVTAISKYAFSDCSSIESLVISEGVTEIGQGAFSYCTSLASVQLPSTLVSIGVGAFQRCTALEAIELPGNEIEIGDAAFNYLADPSVITVATQEQYDLLNDNGNILSPEFTDVVLKTEPVVLIDKPAARQGLVYTGYEQAGVPAGEGYAISGTFSAKNAGSYSATATLLEGYAWSDGSTDPEAIEWSIAKATYDMSGVSFEGATATYDGESHSVFVSGELPEGVSVSYEGNGAVEAGSHEVTASFSVDSNHEPVADMTATVVIKPAAISSASVADVPAQEYTGSAIEPALSLSFNGKALVEGKDYAVAYADNVAAGTATATMTGMGNFAGTAQVSFEIASDMVFIDKPVARQGLAYTGYEQVGVLAGEGYAISGTFSAKNAGTYTAKATLLEGYAWSDGTRGTVEVAWTIARVPIDMSGVSFEGATATYDGEAHSVFVSGELPEGVSVSYEGNGAVEAGSHEVKASFSVDSNHEPVADMTATVVIQPAAISSASVADVPAQDYTGSAIEPALSLSFNGKALVEGKDYAVAYADNVEAGTATATVTGMGNFAGMTQVSFEIASDIVFVDKPVARQGLAYTGYEQVGVPAGEGYAISGTFSAMNAGTYTAKATLLEGYAWADGSTEPVTVEWTIAKATYDMSGVSFEDATATYDGEAHSVFVSGELPEGVSVSYEGNGAVEAGSHEVTASFSVDSNHEPVADMTATVVIQPAAISSASVADVPAQEYTGSAVEPEIELSFNGAKLVEGVDYEVSYSGNVSAGTATATVTGMGNFAGTAQVSFEIKALVKIDKPVARQDLAYTGYEQVGVPAGEGYAISGTFSAKDAGTYSATVSLLDGYAWSDGSTGPVTIAWSIARAPIDMSGVSFASATATYDGESHSVFVSGELPEGVSVSYEGNGAVDAGSYEVTASFSVDSNRGPIADMVASIVIQPAAIFSATVADVPAQVYTGSAIEPALSLSFNGKDLVEGKDYTVAYANNVEAGTATATVTGMGNFAGTAQVSFEIRDHVLVDKPVARQDLVYTGYEQVGVPAGEGYSLSGTLSAQNAGTYSATASLLAGYAWSDGSTGPVTIAWTIARAPIDMSGVSFASATATYDGQAHSVFVSGELPEGVSVSYEGNGAVEAGSHEVTASFSVDSNHGPIADMTATIVIQPAAISSATFEDVPAQVYTGSAIEPALSLSFNGKDLVEGKDYTVAYANNVSAGTATATVAGMGNFAGTARMSFEIVKLSGVWEEGPSGKRYKNPDGTYVADSWKEIDGVRYHFDANGFMQTGWLKDGGFWYFLKSSGAMAASEWVNDGGMKYYLKASGAMAASEWVSVDGAKYHFASNGSMQTGWLKDGSSWYWLKATGEMASSEWVKDGGIWYWLKATGEMAASEWVNDGGTWYHFASSGAMQTGWLNDGGTWYWLKSSGAMAANEWVKTGGTWYHFAFSGAMQTGWIQDEGSWYYLKSSGAMAADQWIGSYYVGSDGRWISSR